MLYNTIGTLNAALDIIRVQTLGHVLDGATDGVAAIQCTLRTTQHFDTLDVIDIHDTGLRAIQVNIIEIDTDTGLETRNRILLANTTDKCGQRRVGAA